jgi:hypothetical protein
MKSTFPLTAILILLSVPTFSLKSQAASPPTRAGKCSNTSVAKVMTRLEDSVTKKAILGSGTSIEFTNGIYLVSYETVLEAEYSKPRDPVKLCLISIPKNCPPGDNRGKVYTATNLRTKKTFTLPDSQHSCGGA